MPIADNTGRDGSPTDAELVAASLGGDRQALADIYDRYSDRVHTMCVHMLNDRDEAADVCGEVFLTAFQRLDQLRDPSRLRPWLYAICRHEVFRRTKRRNRVRLVQEVSEMDRMGVHHDDDLDAADAGALALLVREAAAGLDDRDRMVLELQLQGLDGDDLAAALGTSTSTSYQHVHRMRERMERSVGALLVARQGRGDCADLDAVLAGWDGTFSVLWRKRVARHVDGCEVCERRRKGVPAALFGTAGASPLVATPISVRERVLAAAVVGGGSGSGVAGRRWGGDGFPPGEPEPRRRVLSGLVAGLVLLALGGVLWAAVVDDPDTISVADRSGLPTSTGAPTSTEAASTTSAAATTSSSSTAPTTVPGIVPTTALAAPSTSSALRPTTSVAPTTTGAPATTTTSTTTSATTSTTVVPPTLRLTGPSLLYDRASNGAACSNQPFVATVTSSGVPSSVTLRWTAGAATGTVAMARTRVGTWSGTVDLPFRTTGAVTVLAEATSGGSTGRSNSLTATANPCPVIG